MAKKPFFTLEDGSVYEGYSFGSEASVQRYISSNLAIEGQITPFVTFSDIGRVHITAQNHGYAVDAANLSGGLGLSHINTTALNWKGVSS